MEATDAYSLDDLDGLSPDLSKRICKLLYEPPDDYPSFLKAKKDIEDILANLTAEGIKASTVSINKGIAAGITLRQALQFLNKGYEDNVLTPQELLQYLSHSCQSSKDQSVRKAS